jgi:hypothetical protein
MRPWPILVLLAALIGGLASVPARAAPMPVFAATEAAAPAALVQQAHWHYRRRWHRHHHWRRHWHHRRHFWHRRHHFHRHHWHRHHAWRPRHYGHRHVTFY